MKQEGKPVTKKTRTLCQDAHTVPKKQRTPSPRKLAPMQVMFVEEYLKDLNATQAAIRAGYSAKSAAETAVKLCQKVQVQKAIQDGIAARAVRTGVTADRVLKELEHMALFDPADYTDVTSPADIKALSEEKRRAIIGWGYDKAGNFELEFAKLPALTLCGRHLGLWNDKLKLSGSVSLESLVAGDE